MFGNIDTIINQIGYSVVIQRETRTAGGFAGDTVTWATHLTIRASIQNLSGKEQIQAEKLGIKASFSMYCKVLDITEKDRVYFNSKYYQITYVDNVSFVNGYMKLFLERSDNYGNTSN